MKQVGTSWLVGFLGVAALIGCGGSQQSSFGGTIAGSWNGGSGSRMNQNPKNSNNPGQQPGVNQEISAGGGLPLFITDASDPQVEHAYVRIYEASLYTSKSSIPVFASPEGEVVDLKSLKDAQGMRFLFLGATPMTPPDLVRIQFIIGKEFVVVPKGGAGSEVRQFADQLNEGKNKTRLTLSLPKKDMQALVVHSEADLDRPAVERHAHLAAAETVGIAELEVVTPAETQPGDDRLHAQPEAVQRQRAARGKGVHGVGVGVESTRRRGGFSIPSRT